MKVDVEREDGTFVLVVSGRLDALNAQEFHDATISAVGDTETSVIVDLQDVSYASSSALRVLLLLAKALRERHGGLAICSLVRPVDAVFQVSGFDQIIPVYESRAAAAAAAR